MFPSCTCLILARVWLCDVRERGCGGESVRDPLPRDQQQNGEWLNLCKNTHINRPSQLFRRHKLYICVFVWKQVECKKAQPKEVMSPTGSARGRSRVMPYGMDAFMLGIGMLGKFVLIRTGRMWPHASCFSHLSVIIAIPALKAPAALKVT